VIVNISSMNAWEAFPRRLAYCAAKAAVVAMTQVLAIEWADRGIRVNAVAPGVTRTALVQKAIDDGDIDVAAYTARTPLHRFGEPDEIARAVLYLASDEDSSFVTGTTLCADGGWSAMGWVVT
jgi:NAD(P)-dependent dehydrogenase (short-subunit alcohol dehydrogenase family)